MDNIDNLFNAISGVLNDTIWEENIALISDIKINVKLENGKCFCIEASKYTQPNGWIRGNLQIQPINN